VTLPVLRWIRPRLTEDATRDALEMISVAERRRYDLTPGDQRGSFLAGRLVLRQLAAELTDASASSVDLFVQCADCGGPHGRPLLRGSSLQLSLSRSDNAVVAAASWDGPVGVDVEPATLSGEALAAINLLTGEESVASWTRVEAVLKADGRGLRVDPREVVVDRVGDHFEGSVRDAPVRYRVDDVDLAPDITVSVAYALSR